jgi:hypothetical protein
MTAVFALGILRTVNGTSGPGPILWRSRDALSTLNPLVSYCCVTLNQRCWRRR